MEIKNTFGKDPADIKLEAMLNKLNSPGATRLCNRLLGRTSEIAKELKELPSYHKSYVYNALRQHIVEDIKKTKVGQDDPLLASVLTNCAVKRLRTMIRPKRTI